MDTTGWKEYLKIDDGGPSRTNMVYIPLINYDESILCMDFGNNEILFDNTFFFNREIQYIDRFKYYSWAPEILKIDLSSKKIFFKWYKETCNNIIHSDRDLNLICKDWKEQIKKIINEILNQNVYKLTLYPSCFYIDQQLKIHAMDFYACVDKNDSIFPIELFKNIIGKKSAHRWDEATNNTFVDFSLFFNKALEEHVFWYDIPLVSILNG
jgi:hypothetical protein